MQINLGPLYRPRIIHKKLLLFGPFFKGNLIQFTSPIVFDGPIDHDYRKSNFQINYRQASNQLSI